MKGEIRVGPKDLACRLLLRQANDLRRLYADNADGPPSPDRPWAACVRAVRREGGWEKQDPEAAFRVMAVEAVGHRQADLEKNDKSEFMVEFAEEWSDYSNEDVLDLVYYVLKLEMK